MNVRFLSVIVALLALISCKQPYQVVSMTGQYVEIDSTYDVSANNEMTAFVNEFKQELDAKMGVVLGVSEAFMPYGRPESLLTNLTADVMKKYGDEQLPNGADVGVMNVHGHRANLPKGNITVGNLFEIYSFDNTITFLELKGSDLKDMFDAYARIGGAGISSNVRLVIKNKKVKSVTIDGKPIDENRVYNIVTLDYLAGGNDNMSAFTRAISVNDTRFTLRDLMMDYVKEQTKAGQQITSTLDGRITIEK